jgi:hypothetical protein
MDDAMLMIGLSRDGTCAIERGDEFVIEAAVSCVMNDGRGRLFPFSTLLLGEVVALADAAIYLTESVHALEGNIRNETEEAEDERAGSFTIFFPTSF